MARVQFSVFVLFTRSWSIIIGHLTFVSEAVVLFPERLALGSLGCESLFELGDGFVGFAAFLEPEAFHFRCAIPCGDNRSTPLHHSAQIIERLEGDDIFYGIEVTDLAFGVFLWQFRGDLTRQLQFERWRDVVVHDVVDKKCYGALESRTRALIVDVFACDVKRCCVAVSVEDNRHLCALRTEQLNSRVKHNLLEFFNVHEGRVILGPL